MAAYAMSDAGFFHLAGLPLREGRLFEARDKPLLREWPWSTRPSCAPCRRTRR